MIRSRCLPALLIAGVLLGCHGVEPPKHGTTGDYRPFVQQIEYPDACTPAPLVDANQFVAPPTLANYEQLEQWPLTLSEAVQTALQRSQVLRDLGARVITTPQSIVTTYDPALQETNPLNGPEAALSNFDAQLGTSLFFNRTENKFNQSFPGFAAASRHSNIAIYQIDLSKTTAAGTRVAIRNQTDYDRSRPFLGSNQFPSFYRTLFQAEIRHPLLQGGGVDFNRIAGPNSLPGTYNGVLVARINNDITLVQFERSIRDLCRDVERSYWQLYQSYRELDTRQRARHAAGLIWREEKLRLEAGQARPDDEAQTRLRYYGFQAQVENALSGTSVGQGVFGAERDLRRLMGLPPADGRVIRPTTEPTLAEVVFDWGSALTEALARRVELRQQRWLVRRRELELIAARNYRKPRLDFVSQYGFKGFGDRLVGGRNRSNVTARPGSAFTDLFSGDLQDWQLGLEFTTPVGNRIGHLAVRNAQLQLAREQAIQRDQELQVSHELAAAFAEKERANANMRSNYNARQAALEQIRAIRARAGETERVFFLLDAQQRLADAESAVHRSVFDYQISIVEVELRRGTLLSYMDVALTEGPWNQEAHRSAARQGRILRPKRNPRRYPDQLPVSQGAYDHQRPIDGLPAPAEGTEEIDPIGNGVAPGEDGGVLPDAAPEPPQVPALPPSGAAEGVPTPADPAFRPVTAIAPITAEPQRTGGLDASSLDLGNLRLSPTPPPQ